MSGGRWVRLNALRAALPLAVAVTLAGCSVTVSGSAVTAAEPTTPAAAVAPPPAPRQSELRGFTLRTPLGVAVDTAGNLYATDDLDHSLWKLPAGSTHPYQLAGKFDSDGGILHGFGAKGIAAATDGTLYIADHSFESSKVVTVVEATASVTELPFTGLHGPDGIAVDDGGNVYVVDYDYQAQDHKGRVLKLAAGDPSPSELPFTVLGEPTGVAVDSTGNVYVTDDNHNNSRVLKLTPGEASATEMLTDTGFYDIGGIAVDAADNLYVSGRGTGKDQVVKLAPGAASPTPLPFTDLLDPQGVAVDSAGNVYVADQGAYEVRRGKIWKLAPE